DRRVDPRRVRDYELRLDPAAGADGLVDGAAAAGLLDHLDPAPVVADPADVGQDVVRPLARGRDQLREAVLLPGPRVALLPPGEDAHEGRVLGWTLCGL